MSWLFDPKLFNYLILVLYLLSTVRWAFERDFGQVVYWLGAFILTIAVTFMMDK